MRLVLLRHGQAISNTLRLDDMCPGDFANGLTPRGKKETEQACERLSGVISKPFIYSAPSKRCVETSKIISCFFSIPFVETNALTEINRDEAGNSLGNLNSKTVYFWNRFYKESESEINSITEVEVTKNYIREILTKFSNERELLLISHGGKIELILAILLSIRNSLDKTIQFSLGTGRYHAVDLVFEETRLVHVNLLQLNA
ncbi:phosphoglycerate mutase family protein [Rhizobium acaciae]|uniref:phosphoglycerate mutase family protein n=1 Tax=Rhizobium acaciae TaxID=2989736 RepID=UPI003F94FBB5